MADLIKAKELVKETLLGSDVEDVQLSAQSKATFEKNAQTDAESGEYYMTEAEFINAIAPVGEDYVSQADQISHKSLCRH
jgi:solute carrier family 25 aspartate/glutamate transporter 12/13